MTVSPGTLRPTNDVAMDKRDHLAVSCAATLKGAGKAVAA
jgi:hypothetical protein